LFSAGSKGNWNSTSHEDDNVAVILDCLILFPVFYFTILVCRNNRELTSIWYIDSHPAQNLQNWYRLESLSERHPDLSAHLRKSIPQMPINILSKFLLYTSVYPTQNGHKHTETDV